MMLLKKTVYDKLVTKINAIYTSGSVLKTQYNTNKSSLEKEVYDTDKKIPDTSGLVKKKIIVLGSLRLKVKYLVLMA